MICRGKVAARKNVVPLYINNLTYKIIEKVRLSVPVNI